MSDEEPVCPLPSLRKACEPKCADVFKTYLACADRIEQKGSGDCEAWYFDWLKCIDKCAMPHIMQKLK